MGKFFIQAGWKHSPHLGDNEIAELLASCEPHLRDARSKGIPSMGSGSVFPVGEEYITAGEDFRLKPWYRRFAGMDVGWQATAVCWFAHDVDTDTVYLYDYYIQGQRDPEQHAAAIMRRDPKDPPMKIPIAIDPASQGSSQVDGKNLMQLYRRAGLHLVAADNSREMGIQHMYGYMSAGKFKVVKGPNTEPWFKEFRTFIRDERGRIVNESAYHGMAATRYGMVTGMRVAKPLPMNLDRENIVGSRDYGI